MMGRVLDSWTDQDLLASFHNCVCKVPQEQEFKKVKAIKVYA